MNSFSPWRVPGRIAYVVNHSYPYSTNGYAVRTHGVARGLAELGHSVLVIARPGYPRDLAGMEKIDNPCSLTIEGIRYLFIDEPLRSAGSNEAWLEGAAKSLQEIFRIFKPSAVMSASNWENAVPALRAANSLALPFVYEVRGFWEISRCSREPEFEHSADYAYIVEQESTVARAASEVVTINRLMREELVRRGVERSNLSLLPNGINKIPVIDGHPKIVRESIGIRSRYVVGYIGSFTEYEGIEDLIAAVSKLSTNGVDVSLMLVGSSNAVGLLDSGCTRRAAYRDLAVKLGISERLVLIGRQRQEDVGDYYRIADIIVIPRRPHHVSHLVSPIKPIEAAAWGKCVLLSDVGALKDLQEQIPSFEYFKAGDQADLVRSLGDLLIDHDRRYTISAANRLSASAVTWAAGVLELSQRINLISRKSTAPSTPRHQQVLTLTNEVDGDCHIYLSDEPRWHQFAIEETDFVRLHGTVQYEHVAAQVNGKCVLLVEYYNEHGKLIPGPYPSLQKSDTVGWFAYIRPAFNEELCSLRPPLNAKTVRIGFRAFHATGTSVSIKNSVRLAWLDNRVRSSLNTTTNKITTLPFEDGVSRSPPRLKVASIFDSFSHACFAPECDLISITPEGWRDQLFSQKIDIILVESAWHGNNDSWLYRIANYNSPPGNELKDVLKWAKKFGIPTVFWNKEDPPNFNRFIDRASDFDYIFTTDENCIDRYRQRVPESTYVGALPFAAQTEIHNPFLEAPRLNATSFAGTYYADDFEARRYSMDMLLRTSAQYGLAIFDRMHGMTGDEKKRFLFPEDLRKFIQGSLNYSEMLAAYRRYRVALNVNSVADSPTMFSRRVFELLACGTPVVSTASRGIDSMFHGLVPTVESELEAREALHSLMTSGIEWQRASVRGIRAVYAKHTYAHRLEQMTKAIGLVSKGSQSNAVVVVIPSGCPQNFAKCMVEQRSYPVEVVVSRAGYNPEVFSKHIAALKSGGIRVVGMPHENIASYVRCRYQSSVVALCNSKHHYGPNYLTDALYSVSDASGGVSTIHPSDDIYNHFNSRSFEPFSQIGTSSSLLFVGSIVVSTTHRLLNQIFSLNKEGYVEVPFQARQRAWFDFLPHVMSKHADKNIVNLD